MGSIWRKRWPTAACVAAAALALGVVAPASAATSGLIESAAVPPGGQLWASTYDGSGSQDIARSVAVSPDGQMLFVTGISDVSSSSSEYSTVAYNAMTGGQVWASHYTGTGGQNAAASVAVSPNGAMVFVTGSSASASSVDDFATVAYDAATGKQLWVRRWAGPERNNDQADAVAVGASGHTVLVTGTSGGGPPGETAVTIAYNATTGARLWVRQYAGSNGEALAVSPDGGTAYITGTNGIFFNTIAYAVAGGARKWVSHYRVRTITTRPDSAIKARSVVVGPGGRTVYITGTAGNAHRGTAHDYATVAYRAASGAQLWARRYNGPGNSDDEGHSVAVGPGGHTVYVTGASLGTDSHFDYATIAYSAATGAQMWVARFNNPSNSDNAAAWVVRAAPHGHTVYVTGAFPNQTGSSSATIAYNAATGAMRWITVNGSQFMDSPQTMTLAPNGSAVYVTGSTGEPGNNANNFMTVAYQA